MPGPLQYVAAPTFTPLPFGLVGALSDVIRNPSDGHWQGGVQWEQICAQGGTTYDECWTVTGTGGAPPPPPTKAETTSITRRGAMPFTVYSLVDCSAPGFWGREFEIVGDSFSQSEQWQLERAVWTGAAGGQANVVWPRLAANADLYSPTAPGVQLQTTATPVSGISTALDIVTGLGMLEKALGDCYDGVGVIHAPRNLLAHMLDAHLIYQDGPRYRTGGGNIIVFGAGYPGSSPAGASVAGETWMYATGAMFIYRSSPLSIGGRDYLNRAENTLGALVERNYLIGWDCCHLAINIATGP